MAKLVIQFADQLQQGKTLDLGIPEGPVIRLTHEVPIFINFTGYLFSIASFVQKEDDAPQKAIKYVIVDRRWNEDENRPLRIYPAYFLDATVGQEDHCLVFEKEYVSTKNERMQKIHASIGDTWLQHLKRAGYLA